MRSSCRPRTGSRRPSSPRTPFLAGFQAGWFKFSLCTVHIYYGGDEADQPQRVAEIDALAKFLGDRVRRYRKKYREGGKSHSEYENIALLGDFNIFSTEDETFKALSKNGFVVPEGLHGKITNIGQKGRAFDQIAFLEDEKNVESTGNSGAIDFYRTVYRKNEADQKTYSPMMVKAIDDSNAKKSASKQSTPLCRSNSGQTEHLLRRLADLSDVRSSAALGGAQDRLQPRLSASQNEGVIRLELLLF